MLKRVVKNGSQNAGNATSETQELKNFRGHAPGPLEGSGFATGHPLSTLLDPPLRFGVEYRLLRQLRH